MAESMSIYTRDISFILGFISRISSRMDSCGICGNWDVLLCTKSWICRFVMVFLGYLIKGGKNVVDISVLQPLPFP